MKCVIRNAGIEDAGFLERLETSVFPVFQRTARKNILHGIESQFQDVVIAENKAKVPLGAAVFFKYRRSLRVYSIGILPKYQRKGIGEQLLNYAFRLASQLHLDRVILEAHASDDHLIAWYQKFGFRETGRIGNYYCPGEHAVKMEKPLDVAVPEKKTGNIIVINQPIKWDFEQSNATIISVKEYINNPQYSSNSDLRIFNLCSSYKYQSYGYYVSLLASARGQRCIPSSVTIRDFNIKGVIHSVAYDIEEVIQKTLEKEEGTIISAKIYFGQSESKGFAALAMKLYQLFEAPLFEVVFIKHERWIIKDMKVLTLNKLSASEMPFMYNAAKTYFNKKRHRKTKLVNYKYDIAILIDPAESTPPSCPAALQQFKKAANKRGMYAEFITKADIDKINEFDALFIRETTNVNDHTYEFSRLAYSEGLVVLDDPWSILKCSNKIYQNEIFSKHRILTPKTTVLAKNLFSKSQLGNMQYPLVLKQPDSAFSLGITKVETKEEAHAALQILFKKSDMVVCQEFLYSDFDWRIGILDNQPIFACKYYMSEGHWQIYNWKGEKENNSGESETMRVEEVPAAVVKTAVKAASLIGDGLYGVDLKMIGDAVYVVEVNDNPNVDVGIEDDVLQDELYDRIMASIYDRIEIAKNIQHIDFRHG